MTINQPQMFLNYFDQLVVAMNGTLYTGTTRHPIGDVNRCSYACGTGGTMGSFDPTDRLASTALTSSSIVTATGSDALPSVRIVGNVDSGAGWRLFTWTPSTGFLIRQDLPHSVAQLRLSQDGTVIVGYPSGLGSSNVWRCPVSGVNYTDLGASTVSSSWLNTSIDGSVISGIRNSTGVTWRWTATTGVVDIGVANLRYLSANGQLMCGTVNVAGQPQVAIWTATTGVVTLALGYNSYAMAISGDSQTVVGHYSTNEFPYGHTYMFRWTQATGAVTLAAGNPDLIADTPSDAIALMKHSSGTGVISVNYDGSVIGGAAGTFITSDARAFRWATVGGFSWVVAGIGASHVLHVSNDGNTLSGELGYYSFPVQYSPCNAFTWTASGGFYEITPTLRAPMDSAYGIYMAVGDALIAGTTHTSPQHAAYYSSGTGLVSYTAHTSETLAVSG